MELEGRTLDSVSLKEEVCKVVDALTELLAPCVRKVVTSYGPGRIGEAPRGASPMRRPNNPPKNILGGGGG